MMRPIMDRIAKAFENARRQGRACFVAYVCAGDPDPETSLEVCKTLIDAGVDILELGAPFSDPLADGLTNQLAAQRALEAGMTQAKTLDLVRAIRRHDQTVPIVFYTYCNLVFAKGERTYAKAAREAGADGLLTLDCPPEEAASLIEACKAEGLSNIFIIAPTTPPDRVRTIAKSASGFIYYVSREGVTGERSTLASDIGTRVAAIKAETSVPVVVGFGISTAAHVREVGSLADGAVVGSALVNCIARNPGDRKAMLAELDRKARELVGGLRS